VVSYCQRLTRLQREPIFLGQVATSRQGQQAELYCLNMNHSWKLELEWVSGGLVVSPPGSVLGKLSIELLKQLSNRCLAKLGLYANLEKNPVALVRVLKRTSPRAGLTWCCLALECPSLAYNSLYLVHEPSVGSIAWLKYRLAWEGHLEVCWVGPMKFESTGKEEKREPDIGSGR
jgi:hypothetical protein